MKKLTIITALCFCTANLFAQTTATDSVPTKPVTDTVKTAPAAAAATAAPATTKEEPSEGKKKKATCIRAGWQYSNLINGDVTSENSLNSFYVGINRKIKLISILKLETGVEYMIAGADYDNDTQMKLQYVGIPINFSVTIGPVYAIAGVTANWMVDQEYTVNGSSVAITDNNKASSFDWTAGIGAGVNILMFSAEVRYYYGLSEVVYNSHNSFIQAGLRFNF